jgi:hypothetical protein
MLESISRCLSFSGELAVVREVFVPQNMYFADDAVLINSRYVCDDNHFLLVVVVG